MYATVRLGSLARGQMRSVWPAGTAHQRFAPLHVAIGARAAMAVITHREGAAEGAYRALLLRPGRPPKRLLPTLALGDWHEGGLGIDHVSTDGRRVTIERRFDEQQKQLVFALPSGRAI
jgi:hypothetical protein